jgi:hypothetical protein
MIASFADLITFLKRFHRYWLEDASLDPSLIPADLPPPLATLYRELGALVEIDPGPTNDWRCPFHTQDSLTPLSQLQRVEGMIEFAWENQGNWSARCPLGEPDPPVYSNAKDLWEEPRQGFVVVCDSLSHFLTTLCLQEAVMGCRSLVALHTDRPLTEVLTLPLEPLWLDGCYVSGEPDHKFFVSPEQDVLVMDWGGIWLASLTDNATDLVVDGIEVQVVR